MVTELAPISLLIRQARHRQFVIEEPEAHLHLSAQRDMARAIVRLVNAGANVVVTTHSDTFLQQLNLCIALSSEGEEAAALRQRHGYQMDDLLTQGAARCFEFVPGEGGTVIREAELTEDGFVVKSINEPLFDLAKEVLAVQSADEID
jgi:ABC-type multidrug transport system ATPase subunit